MKRTFTYMERDLRRWIRGRINVITSLVMPAAWLIFVGLALPIRFTDNYLDFITPGILVLTMLGASLQGGALLMFDKILGFLQKFLAMPAPRESILFGKILAITLRGLIQTTVILVIALILGAHLLNPVFLLQTYLILFIFGVLLSSIMTTVALSLEDHDSYAAFNSMIAMPLFFTSSALMPYDQMPGWLAFLAHLNPVSYAIDAIRALQEGIFPATTIAGLLIGAVVVLSVCIITFRRATV
ncbi:MAG: Daunorubicin resistance ABC transporter membrane protein [Methanomicrobiales archaeon 53_19]|uniref:ABC transporter permease n=1 Tax=Methanocalculus sp. TaxID=2004547 RepID=UPI000746A070|nr:ABC transporter permease [Methanocalculus sp.]KUL01594.1 MAG: Daunorubicin resistance ABC transporter membrane protein [Methanomicrobiales archaeon 53_19]HIJ06450.1 ABC transporter permease [Methanocalculus sp.]